MKTSNQYNRIKIRLEDWGEAELSRFLGTVCAAFGTKSHSARAVRRALKVCNGTMSAVLRDNKCDTHFPPKMLAEIQAHNANVGRFKERMPPDLYQRYMAAMDLPGGKAVREWTSIRREWFARDPNCPLVPESALTPAINGPTP